MDKSKAYCEFCKIQVPVSFLRKHQSSDRHLRSKAAKMFYQSKSKGNPQKRPKYEDPSQVQNSNLSNLPINSQVSTINSQVKGVWSLVQDPMTGRTQYKNRLSGRLQSNKPIGLNDDSLEYAPTEQIVVGDYEKVVFNDDQEFEEPEIGRWVDIDNSYWFGGRDVAEDEQKNRILQEIEKGDEEKYQEMRDFQNQDKEKIWFEEVGHGKKREREGSDEERGDSSIEMTETLKQQLENKEIELELIEKPRYICQANTMTSFGKRNSKGKNLLQ